MVCSIFLFSFLVGSFIYGWYLDPSTAGAEEGWADQSLYTNAAASLAQGDLPKPGALHYQMLYPLMGAVGFLVLPSDPFMPVSLSLLLGSAAFIFLAARRLLGWGGALTLVALVFAWDLHGRTFNFPSELFVIPWNNQVVFFSLAYFFWLLATKTAKSVNSVSPWIYLSSGLVTGVTIGSREEAALFLIQLLAYFLIKSQAGLRMWALTLGAVFAGYLPHLIIKTLVLGDVMNTGRQRSYVEALSSYVSWDRLSNNVLDVVVNSSARGVEADRLALLQAAPWLWLSPLGLAFYIADRNQNKSVKAFLIVSVALFFFYLAGENMSLEKLKFHCIRYLSPALICLNFAVVYLLVSGSRRIKTWLR
jgi:hypothetical protein